MFASSVMRRLGKTEARKFSTRTSFFTNIRSKLAANPNVPLYGATVGTMAFIFQVFVLFPWHVEISDQFEEVQKVVLKIETMNGVLESKMDKVARLEEEIKIKQKRILDKEEEILKNGRKVSAKLDELRARHII